MNMTVYGKKRSARLLSKRCILLLLLTSVFHAFAFSQKISLTVTNMPLEQVFGEIENRSNYRFVFVREELKQSKPVTLNVNKVKIETVLQQVFDGEPLAYSINKNYITVFPRPERAVPTPVASTPVDVRGLVSNENGDPVPGASISTKDGALATASDETGAFFLSGVDDKAVLVVTSIGYRRQEVPVNGRSNISIQLTTFVGSLDETVLIAYGATSKRLNTGSVSTLKARDIEKQPISNPLAAIQGRLTGILVTQQSGLPGGGFTVQIRGRNSLRPDGNNPLYIIDGVPFISGSLGTGIGNGIIPQSSPFNSLDPTDIERIEVLKDADATAIYGSRGANGVVLITTKRAKQGRTRVSFNFYAGQQKVGKMIDLLHTPEYLQMRHEAFKNDAVTPTISNARDLLSWDTTRYTDWQKTLIGGTAHILNAQVSFSGGSARTQFLFGGGFHRETTVFPGNMADQKGSLHFNLNHTSENDRLHLFFATTYVSDKNNLISLDLTNQAMILIPNAPALFDSSGKLNWQGSTWYNPLAYLNEKYQAGMTNLVSSGSVGFKIFEGFEIMASLGYSQVLMKEIETFPKSSYYPDFLSSYTPQSSFGNSSFSSWIAEPQAEYKKKFGQSKLEFLIGGSFQESNTESQNLLAKGFTSDALMENLQAASNVTVSSYKQATYRYNAIFGRVNYNFGEKYLLNLTGRRDGSSRFGPNRQFANFGAVGGAWIFTQEKWFRKHLEGLSFGKLRVSYGITGSDQIPDYGYLDTYAPTTYPYQNISSLVPTRLQNDEFSWETNRKIELATELGFFSNRILFSAGFYKNRSSNQLVGYPLPLITGFSSIQANLPAVVQNTGLEFEMTISNPTTHNFHYEVAANLTIPRNKLVSYPEIENSTYAKTYTVGKSLEAKKTLNFLGVDPATGVYIFADINKDNKISLPEDLVSTKTLGPECYGGLSSEFSYKNLAFSFLFQFFKGNGLNYLSTFINTPGKRVSNQPVWVLDRWQKTGDQAPIEQFTQSGANPASPAYLNLLSSNALIDDASFIRLKNISVSYRLPEAIIKRARLQSANLFLQGQNLFTITRYQGLDPETQNANSLPILRIWSAGFNLNF